MNKLLFSVVILFISNISFAQSLTGTYSWLPERASNPKNFSNTTSKELGEFGFIAQGMSFYIPVDDSPIRATMKINNSKYENLSSSGVAQYMVRVFNPDERLTHWEYNNNNMNEPIYNPKDTYVDDLSSLSMTQYPNKFNVWGPSWDNTVDFSLVEKGIHEIRYNGNGYFGRSALRLALSENTPYGVSFQNGEYKNWESGAHTYYVYIPHKAEELHFSNVSGITIKKEDGSLVNTAATVYISKSDWGKVWTLSASDKFKFKVYGFPFILCSTSELASNLHASVEQVTTDTGTFSVSHKIQKKILEVIPEILKAENIGNTNTIVSNTASLNVGDGWLNNPSKNVFLTNEYQPAFAQKTISGIAKQNIDVSSPFVGMYFTDDSGNWDNFLTINTNTQKMGAWLGQSSIEQESVGLSILANKIEQPFNPYVNYQDELNYRIALNMLKHLCKLGESENFPSGDKSSYPGGIVQFGMIKYAEVYQNVVPYLPNTTIGDLVKEIWTEVMRKYIDRHYTNTVVSTRNQSAHALLTFNDFAKGNNDPVYQNLSTEYARIFTNSQASSGYYEEATGPDASYEGMTNYHLGAFYTETEDLEAKDLVKASIEKVYELFNSTVAQEPNGGKIIGGFNFNHRIGFGFDSEQWGGAKDIALTIPKVGIWSKKSNAELLEKKDADILRLTKTLSNTLSSLVNTISWMPTFNRYKNYTSTPEYEAIPANRLESFIHTFSNKDITSGEKSLQLVAVKTPSYYTSIYCGNPAAGEFYLAKKTQLQSPFAGETDPNTKANAYVTTPFVGGGLTNFWNKDYGTSVLATSWSPLYHNGFVAKISDDKRYWEEYFSIRSSFDEANKTLTITGDIENQGINYQRKYFFYDGYLNINLTYGSNSNISLMDFWENIPYVTGDVKLSALTVIESTDNTLSTPRTQIFIKDSNNNGMKLLFDKSVNRKQVSGMEEVFGRFHVDHYEIDLVKNISRGETYSLSYNMIPVDRLTQGLAGQWRWKNDAKDNSGYEIHGSLKNTPTYGSDKGCTYISLDGVDQVVETVPFKNETSEISIMAWAKSTIWGGAILSKKNAFILKTVDSNKIEFQLKLNGVYKVFTATVANNFNWHFYAFTYKNGAVKLYVDGVLVSTSVASGTIDSTEEIMTIGQDFKGDVGEVRLHTIALGKNEILDIFDNSCFSSIINVAVTGISVNPNNVTLEVGSTQNLTATVSPVDADNKEVIWESNNPSIASVDQNGVVTNYVVGDVIITATTVDGGFTDKATLVFDDSALAVEEAEEFLKLGAKVFPNPTEGSFNVLFENSVYLKQLYLYDALGRVLLEEKSAGEKSIRLDLLSTSPKGIYFLKIIENNNQEIIKITKH